MAQKEGTLVGVDALIQKVKKETRLKACTSLNSCDAWTGSGGGVMAKGEAVLR